MIRLSVLAWAFAPLVPMCATTVRSASLDDLIQTSTNVVRGRVVASSVAMRGPAIYTLYTVQVLDRWKGAAAGQLDVQVPGGTLNGVQQSVAGAPQLIIGSQYVFFLWTAPSGANLPLGLTQGVLDVATDDTGNMIVVRQATEALVLNSASGNETTQDPLRMKLADFATRVSSALKGGSAAK
jgi:hypothetical protein